MAGEERAREIIRDALARALFDAPPEVLDDLASTALEGRARRCNGPVLLARRIAAELAHAGWVLKSARDCPAGAGAVQRRLALEDHIVDAVAVQELPEQQPRRAGADDNDLGAQFSFPGPDAVDLAPPIRLQ